jgi:hypothetical protein
MAADEIKEGEREWGEAGAGGARRVEEEEEEVTVSVK